MPFASRWQLHTLRLAVQTLTALPAQRQPYTYAAPLILRQPLSKWRNALASRHIPALTLPVKLAAQRLRLWV